MTVHGLSASLRAAVAATAMLAATTAAHAETDATFDETFDHHTMTLENGVKLHYVRGGQPGGEAGSAPTLFLAHGLPFTWYEWREAWPRRAF